MSEVAFSGKQGKVGRGYMSNPSDQWQMWHCYSKVKLYRGEIFGKSENNNSDYKKVNTQVCSALFVHMIYEMHVI